SLDSRRVGPGELFVALPGERVDGRRFAGAALAAGAAGVLADAGGEPPAAAAPPRDGAVLLLATDARAALAVLAARWRASLPVAVAAVTGTNGKTTTKDLLAALLAAAGPTHATAGNLNNTLGLPLTLLGLTAAHRFAVIELGASAEGDIARLAPLVAPRVGVITNASPAHLAEFGSLEGIVRGKGELLDALPPDGTAVLNADSPGFAAWVARARCRLATHGETGGDSRWRWRPAAAPGHGLLELEGRTWEVPLPGRHNGANLVAALLAARALGVDERTAAAGLARFTPSPHRGHLARIGGVLVLDDCYNANPASMLSAAAALVSLAGHGRALAVLGVMAELGETSAQLHRQTGERLAATGLDELLAIGPGAEGLAEGFAAAAPGRARWVATKPEAARWLAAQAGPGDRVLVKGSRSAGMEDILAAWRLAATGSAGV
ncbi:MAG: UDP-N-acetylmuramoyl-tripeptide--D-alanyl-D-alanine ligase, partial [Candidatus Krumholzibacteriia bacterium]